MTSTASSIAPLSWSELEALTDGFQSDPTNGETNAQARLRLFGQTEADVRVTLYRDNHAWCPYCQKIWLWLEEKRIPYRIEKVTMFCYGEKESWYKRKVPSGMLPAIELDGRLITESDDILIALEQAFGALGLGMKHPRSPTAAAARAAAVQSLVRLVMLSRQFAAARGTKPRSVYGRGGKSRSGFGFDPRGLFPRGIWHSRCDLHALRRADERKSLLLQRLFPARSESPPVRLVYGNGEPIDLSRHPKRFPYPRA